MFSDAWLKRIRPNRPDGPLLIELDLTRGVLSTPPRNPLEAFRARQSAAMREIRDGLRRAAEDPQVTGLAVHVGTCPLTPDQCDELAEMITAFGRLRPTVAWTESFGEMTNGTMAYRVAAAAQQIWLQPTGALGLHGVQSSATLLRGTFDKIGVEPEFGQRKEYKTAGDQFAAHEVTDAHREMLQRIADSILDDTVERVAKQRNLDPAAVRLAVDNAPLTAQEALEARLVDRIGYRDEVYADLRSRFGEKGDDEKPTLALQYAHRYARAHGSGPRQQLENLLHKNKPAIGVVSIHGAIVQGLSQGGPGGQNCGSDTVCAHLREAARDEAVKAVVVRVDSPGGSAVASDAIRREVLQVRAAGKPVVVSMGNVAASGGYFVAMGADQVVANPTTLTGSIGVVAGKLVTRRLADKIGLVREEINAGANAGMMSSLEPFDEEQWRRLDAWLDRVYDDFTSKAAADRGMPLEQLEPLARGRVWTGADAHARGLVDRLGGMGAALDLAAERVGTPLEKLAVRAVPAMPMLELIEPPESSESSTQMAAPSPLLTGGPEERLAALAGLLGLSVPHGALALPWRITLS